MDKIILSFIGSALISATSIYTWSKLYREKINFKSIKMYIIFLALSIFMTFNYLYMNSYMKILTLTVFMIICNYILFKKKVNEIILAPVVSQFLFFISELVLSVIAFGILKIDAETATNKYFGTIPINFIISLICLILINIKYVKNLYNFLVKVTDKISKKTLVFVIGIAVITANFFAASQYYQMNSLYIVIINCSLTVLYTFIVFKMLEEKNRYIKINNKYNMTATTLKELEQNVTRLKIVNHENKNQLLTIRNMIKKKDKDVTKHIDKIVDQKIKDDELLMFQTSTIRNSMIGSIIYSKMLTMKENNIKTNLSVDSDLCELDFINIDEDLTIEICKILGVYLDNSIEEVSKLKEKLINIEVYKDNENLCMSISNNFEGEIDLDLLDNVGYTTKEKGHGYGLSLVKEIIESNKKLENEKRVVNNIFTQILKIKM